MWTSVLIANRGEIARRVARSARELGLKVIAVYHDDDAEAPFVKEADEAYPLGGGAPSESYLNIPKLIEIAQRSGAQLVHPGYGFLSERADFARACEAAGLSFVGPSPALIERMGDKAASRRAAQEHGFPLTPGYDGPDLSAERLIAEGERLGAPLMVKATHGGGGRGMRLVTELSELPSALEEAEREARGAFGEGSLMLERALVEARHIEVQVFGDHEGRVVQLGERDCTLQRRRQKVLEESPSPALNEALRAELCEAARRLAEGVGYVGAGTVECLVTPDGSFYFCEMNTRLQVEHAVTELRYGVDLVAWQLRVAMMEGLPLSQAELDERLASGRYPQHVIEVRLCAEDPIAGYLPQAGPVRCWRPPSGAGLRVDDGVGPVVSARFDSMLAKLISAGETRALASERLARALRELTLIGPSTNLPHLLSLIESEAFVSGALHTKSLDEALPGEPLAPRPPPPLSALERALAALSLSLPALSADAQGLTLSPLSVDGWGSSTRGRWLVSLAHDTGRSAASFALWVESRGARAAQVEVDGELIALSELCYDPELARLSFKVDSEVDSGLDSGPRRSLRAWLEPASAALELLSEEGHTRRFRDLSYELAVRESAEEDEHALLAPITGLISSVCCVEGERVTPDKTLITIEAMKLEHALFSPRHTSVVEIHVKEGEQVSAGQLLLQLKP